MDNGIWIGLLSALSALAGAAISQWGTLRATLLRSRLDTDRDRIQRRHEIDSQRAAVLAHKREEFLGLVLLARSQIEALVYQSPTSLPASVSEHAATSARHAYAVALLYLADMRPLAKAFYDTTARFQQALLGDDDALAMSCQIAWLKSFSDIEKALADLSAS